MSVRNLFVFPQSLSRRVAIAGIWSFALQFSEQICVFGRVFVVAVFLQPRDFGLYSMATLAFLALDVVSRIGFEQALIQKKDGIGPYLEAAWTVRCLRGISLATLFFCIAPLVSAFFGEPDAALYIRALSLSFVFQGCINIGVVFFQRDLQFHKEYAYRFSGTLADLLVTVVAAYKFHNAWALVCGYLAADLTRLLASYWLHPFRPRLRWDWDKTKEMFRYGVWVLLFGVAIFAGENGAGVVIGRIIGAAALGYFQMAHRITGLAVRHLGITIHRVAFPAYSQLQGSEERMREAYRKIAGFSAVLVMPASAGIFCMGHDFTRIFWGAKWMPMVPSLLVLAVANLVGSIPWTGRPAFMGKGRPQTVFYMQLALCSTLFVLVFPLASRWGLLGAAFAMLLSNLSALAVWFVNIRPQLGISGRELGHLFLPPMAASVMMAVSLTFLRIITLPWLPGQRSWNIAWFVFMIVAGVVLYTTFIITLHKRFAAYRPFVDLFGIFTRQA